MLYDVSLEACRYAIVFRYDMLRRRDMRRYCCDAELLMPPRCRSELRRQPLLCQYFDDMPLPLDALLFMLPLSPLSLRRFDAAAC